MKLESRTKETTNKKGIKLDDKWYTVTDNVWKYAEKLLHKDVRIEEDNGIVTKIFLETVQTSSDDSTRIARSVAIKAAVDLCVNGDIGKEDILVLSDTITDYILTGKKPNNVKEERVQ